MIKMNNLILNNNKNKFKSKTIKSCHVLRRRKNNNFLSYVEKIKKNLINI